MLTQLDGWRERMLGERGSNWVHAADEFYLAAGSEFPSWDDYDDFPQYENGIGMVRAFLDELIEALGEFPDRTGVTPVTLVTGTLFAPVLDLLAPALSVTGCVVSVLPVANDLLGGNVGVAGLLAGGDIARAITACGARDVYLVPDVAINDDDLFLDDLTVPEVARAARADVRLVSCDAAGLVSALLELSTANSG